METSVLCKSRAVQFTPFSYPRPVEPQPVCSRLESREKPPFFPLYGIQRPGFMQYDGADGRGGIFPACIFQIAS